MKAIDSSIINVMLIRLSREHNVFLSITRHFLLSDVKNHTFVNLLKYVHSFILCCQQIEKVLSLSKHQIRLCQTYK